MTGPTPRQLHVLEYLRSYIAEHGYAPTLKEIGEHFEIRSSNGVNDHLRALERKGLITRERKRSRAISIVEASDLERYSDAELRRELQRRKAARSSP